MQTQVSKKALTFDHQGGIFPLSFSDEGKHAVRNSCSQRAGIGANPQRNLNRYHSRMKSGRRPIQRLNEWFYKQAGWNRECFSSIRPGKKQGGCFLYPARKKKEGFP